MLECEQCGKELPEGTKAHIIEYRRIDVRGTRVIIKCVAEESLERLLVGDAAGGNAFVVIAGHFEEEFRFVGGGE